MTRLFWTQRQDIGPSARFGHALTYDETAGQTLLVGGNALGSLLRDTWIWNGEAWTQVEDIGPTGRSGHALAFDTARSRTVLFGGSDGGALADTWEWDGEGWTQLEDTGPAARSRHALAYDAARSRVVLFGGEGAEAGLLGDTWAWDGDEWTQLADTGPAARAGHAMCYEPAAARTILFGGSAGSDTWAWDGAVWTELNEIGPQPCQGSGLVCIGQTTVLFGGIGPEDDLSRQTWELEGGDWTERQDMGPAARHRHAMCFDKVRGRIVLFGGLGAPADTATQANLLSDTWELPRVAQSPGPDPGPDPDPGPTVALVSFTISPDTAAAGEEVTFTIELDQPGAAPVAVAISVDGTGIGDIVVDAGQASWSGALASDQLGLPPGAYTFTATLGAVSLDAPLTLV